MARRNVPIGSDTQSSSDTYVTNSQFGGEPDLLQPGAHVLCEGLLSELIETHRLRDDLLRAEGNLTRQLKSACRRLCGGSIAEGNALLKKCEKGEGDINLDPLLLARAAVHGPKLQRERRMREIAHKLPAWEWASSVRGLGEIGFAQIVAEARDPMRYDTVAKLWSRMGVGIKGGERQRRVAGAKAIEMGYSPRRRALLFLIGDNLIRAKNPEYRAVYDSRKAHTEATHAEWTKMHRHRDAHRYMTKRLLRELWVQWRRALCQGASETQAWNAESAAHIETGGVE
jgi:hypothetical protein